MCGIIGIASNSAVRVDTLLDGLSRLDYRGYDSAGISFLNNGLEVTKRSGRIDELREDLAGVDSTFRFGIGHTRWSTHGSPTDANAHPHTDSEGTVAVVHNGIIENHDTLRDELRASGVNFTSQTDTEVVPHLIRRAIRRGAEPREAFDQAIKRLEGSFAVCALVEDVDGLFVARQSSPLSLGFGSGTRYIASDVPAFLEHTRDVAYLENGQQGHLLPQKVQIWDESGTPVGLARTTVEWTVEQTEKQGYEHFFRKELDDQPQVAQRAVRDRVSADGELTFDSGVSNAYPDAVHLIGCGTSYHASLYGAYLFRAMGIPAYAHRGSEYGAVSPPATPNSTEMVVGITQSGETADILHALDSANDHGRRTLVLTNVLGSTAIRKADEYVTIRAGPEVSVAATKTFTADLLVLNLLGEQFTSGSHERLIRTLRDFSGRIRETIDGSEMPELATEYADCEAAFFLGRGLGRPIALEGALKLKELSYKHAEGFGAGELKHGPLALLTEHTPVIALFTGNATQTDRVAQNVREAQARDAPVIAVAPEDVSVPDDCDHRVTLPEVSASLTPVLANVHLQLFAYHLADELDRPIDKPRHLAKSVTVR